MCDVFSGFQQCSPQGRLTVAHEFSPVPIDGTAWECSPLSHKKGAADVTSGIDVGAQLNIGEGSPVQFFSGNLSVLSDLSTEDCTIQHRPAEECVHGRASKQPKSEVPCRDPSVRKTEVCEFSLVPFTEPEKKLLVTVSIEIGRGERGAISMFEGDDCEKLANIFIREHGLDETKVFIPLKGYLQDTMKQHSTKEGTPCRNEKRNSSLPPPSPKYNSTPVQRRTDKNPTPSSKHQSKKVGSSFATPKKKVLADTTNVVQQSSIQKNSRPNVAARYLTPKKVPVPPQEQCSFKPTLSKTTVTLYATPSKKNVVSGSHTPAVKTSSGNAFNRLYDVAKDREHRRREQIQRVNETAKNESGLRYSQHCVKGLDWNKSPVPKVRSPSVRLHENAEQRSKKLITLAEKIKQEREDSEMKDLTLKPKINKRSSVSHVDPSASHASALSSRHQLSSEELAMKACTFRPNLNKHQNTPLTNARAKQTEPLSQRLLSAKKKKEEKLEEARKFRDTVDPKTGRALFKPLCHKERVGRKSK